MLYPRLKSWGWAHTVGYCDGAVLAIRRKAFVEIGGFDEEFTFYAEETDFCKRLHTSGWGVYFQPKATVMHIRGASSGEQMNQSEKAIRKLVASKVQFMRKHYNSQRTRRFITFEILNNEFKKIVCKILLCLRPSKQLQTKLQTFHLLSTFYREIH